MATLVPRMTTGSTPGIVMDQYSVTFGFIAIDVINVGAGISSNGVVAPVQGNSMVGVSGSGGVLRGVKGSGRLGT